MAPFTQETLAAVIRLQVSLYACHARLAQATDAEALHDLRISLRRLRSLLRPLGKQPACIALRCRAAEVARLTGPLRDLEVLLGHLQEQGMTEAVRRREPSLQRSYAALLRSRHLAALCDALDQWPEQWRQAARESQLEGLRRRTRRRLARQQQGLAAALVDPAHDRHRLRLLIKRVRYGAEAYPRLSALSAASLARLKQAQAALGDWHDLLQWLARAERETDLACCVPGWRRALASAERAADQALTALQQDFR